MNTRNISILVLVLLVVAAACALYAYANSASVNEAMIRTVVTDFGGHLKDVSLLSPTASEPGTTYVTLTLASTTELGTNFSDARITVGARTNPNAAKDCLSPAANPAQEATTTTTIHGVTYTVVTSSDAGAGNLYTTTSYRALRGTTCYAIESTVHTTNINNYPAGAVQPYNAAKIQALIDGVVKSFALTS